MSQSFQLTDEFEEVLDLLENTDQSIFLTGKAGTGKSTLLRHFLKTTKKKYAVLAPTGIAALNVGGQTIHSFFRFPPAIIQPEKLEADPDKEKLYKSLQMLIIDEVSMVRADLMHGIDEKLRLMRDNWGEPFGGVQMVLIGDLFQLPPVVRKADFEQLNNRYECEYFFAAPVFNDLDYEFKELTHIFRQGEGENQLKDLLNKMRTARLSMSDLNVLNQRFKSQFVPKEQSVFLTARRAVAKRINEQKLSAISTKEYEYTAQLSGKFEKLKQQDADKLDGKLSAPYKLKLKVGAQIMMLRNDTERRWVNGSIGRVEKLAGKQVYVQINGKTHEVEREDWKEVKYVYNTKTKQIDEETVGEFSQYPMCLAWAITIHKSQGKTFENIIVDVSGGAFAHGQVYVALSRCRTLEGITLTKRIKPRDIIVDPRILEFHGIYY